jgi:curved DNA-binding protein CbpA
MQPDFFALLNQPRRPWLDLDRLKQEYQRLTFEQHPDRTDGVSERRDFAEITEAYRVLSSPKLRLQHLLSLQGEGTQTSELPGEMADIFMEIATLVNDTDRSLQRRHAASSALAKSMLRSELTVLQHRLDAALLKLNQRHADLVADLNQIDQQWAHDRAAVSPELAKLSQRFGFLDRWIAQLREKQFQLSTE